MYNCDSSPQLFNQTALNDLIRDLDLSSLIDSKDVLLSCLHIKLGLMKQFVKALSAESECFRYLRKKFPSLSKDEIKKKSFC